MTRIRPILLITILLSLLLVACGGSEPEPIVQKVITEINVNPLPTDGGGAAAVVDPAPEVMAEPTAVPAPATENTGDLQTIVVWAEPWTARHMVENPDADGQYGLRLKELFEQQNPGYTVSIEDHSWDNELRQNFMTSTMAGTAPDVIVSENFFKAYADLGMIIPIDEYIADVKDDLIPGTYAAANIDGNIYGISQFTGVFGFERNCEVLAKANIDCTNGPVTWDELASNASAVTQAGNGEFYGFSFQGPNADSVGSVFRVAVLIAQANASLCQNDCTFPYFNDPEAVKVYEFLRGMNKFTPPGLSFEPDEGKVYTQLFEGKSAYQIAGSWHPGWASGAGCTDCRYSGVPIPTGGKPASIIVGNGIYAVTAQSKHPQQAANFVKLLANPEMQDLIFSAMGRLPTTRSGLTALRPSQDAAMQAYIDELLNNPDLGILPSWPTNPQQVWTIYNNMLTEVLTSDRPVIDIMNEAQASAELAVR